MQVKSSKELHSRWTYRIIQRTNKNS